MNKFNLILILLTLVLKGKTLSFSHMGWIIDGKIKIQTLTWPSCTRNSDFVYRRKMIRKTKRNENQYGACHNTTLFWIYLSKYFLPFDIFLYGKIYPKQKNQNKINSTQIKKKYIILKFLFKKIKTMPKWHILKTKFIIFLFK